MNFLKKSVTLTQTQIIIIILIILLLSYLMHFMLTTTSKINTLISSVNLNKIKKHIINKN